MMNQKTQKMNQKIQTTQKTQKMNSEDDSEELDDSYWTGSAPAVTTKSLSAALTAIP